MASGKASAKKQKTPEVEQQLEDKHEFIPYHSHYDAHTLITKNGELLQIIKIDGNFLGKPCENLDGTHASPISTIRQVIAKSGASEKFAFWLHTIRKRNPMIHNSSVKEAGPADSFADYVSNNWEKTNNWDAIYQNEIYLTILYEGQNISLFDKDEVPTFIFPKFSRRFCNKYLESVYPILDDVSLTILEGIRSQCSAHRLALSERAISNTGKVARPSIFYSEPMEFMGMLLNLRCEQFPLPDLDLSVAMQTTELVFGFNAIEAKSENTGKKRFAAMLSLKQYIDMYAEAVDCVLQAPIELIISQSFSFTPADRVLKHYEVQKSLFNMSGDLKSNENFGINQMFDFKKNTTTDFGEHQTSIMILVDDLRKLDDDVGKFLKEFARLGLIAVREDIKMEECFWAQLPGNFEFIRRASPIATGQIAGFCRLNCFHTGNAINNHWGSSVALIPTNVNSPYFFNFHVQDNGHTVIFDFNSFDDHAGKILEYFLLTKTRKFNARIFIFDRNQSARLLLNKIGGKYFPMTQLEKFNSDKLESKSLRLALNPFTLEPSNYNNSFLVAWCGLLIAPDAVLDDSVRALLREAIEKLYMMPASERNLSNMISLVAQSDPDLAHQFEQWVGQGEYAGLFDFAEDSLNVGADMVGFDMTSAIARPAFLLPLFSYLMHRIIDSIDGQPTIIVFNEAWDLMENNFFSPRLESLLEMLRQKNVMVMFTTNRPSSCNGTSTLSALMERAATKIYIPDEMPVNYKSQDIGLNATDEILLLGMQRQKGDFLLKQNNESTVLRIALTEMEDATAIFMNDIKAIIAARGRFAGSPKDY